MGTLYLCGAGNPEGVRLAIVVNQFGKYWDLVTILDDNPEIHGQAVLGKEVKGGFDLLTQADPSIDSVVNLVAKSTAVRRSARDKIQIYGLPFIGLIHPTVDIFGVHYSEDITVYQNVSFCAGATVGNGSVCLTGSVIGHGSVIGRNCIVAPGAVINARVELGEGVYVGTNSSILPDLKIGPWSTIGSNSAVIQDVPAGATVMGVPAQVIIGGQDNAVPQAKEVPGIVDASTAHENPSDSDKLNKLRSAKKEFLLSNHRSNKAVDDD